jgi:Lon protease-like protein
MSDDQATLARFDGLARLFPLPNLVLFPQGLQGLHVFEPRYRQMTADALASDEFIAPVLLQPGWENEADDRPALAPVACLAQIVQHEQLADGRFNLRARGIARLKLIEEVRTDRLYRTARAEPMPDVVSTDLGRLTSLRRRLAGVILPQFDAGGPAHRHLSELFDGDLALGPLCDLLAFALPIPVELKQQLLEEPHVDIRAEILGHALQIAPADPDRKFPPDFSVN